MRARYNRSCTANTTLKYLRKNYPNEGERKNMRNKNLTAAAAVATAAALMLFTAKTGTQTIGVTFGWLLSFFACARLFVVYWKEKGV